MTFPAGWEIERVRSLEPSAKLLDLADHPVFYQNDRQQEFETLAAACILSFSGLCLVRVMPEDQWYMGDLDPGDGSIVCWASYGSDLEQAVRSL